MVKDIRTPKFLEPYQRISSSGQFIPEVDGLRFFAIFSVFIYHLTGDILRHSSALDAYTRKASAIFPATQVLNVGVQLFFVISGFILGLPFATAHLANKKPVSLKKYFLRRVTRLEPPYIISLLLFFVLKILGEGVPPPRTFLTLLQVSRTCTTWFTTFRARSIS